MYFYVEHIFRSYPGSFRTFTSVVKFTCSYLQLLAVAPAIVESLTSLFNYSLLAPDAGFCPLCSIQDVSIRPVEDWWRGLDWEKLEAYGVTGKGKAVVYGVPFW